jgi:pteridine reductase
MNDQPGVALVTGAARRVGRAIALELARAGFDVAVHYCRSEGQAQDVSGLVRSLGRRAVPVPGDLADPDTPARVVEATLTSLGGLTVLVNNASVFDATDLDTWTAGEWAGIFQVNAIAPAMLSQAAAPHLRASGRGRIVNLTDILAERPARHLGAYCASKAALVSITRSLARELAPDITVNAVAPGIAVFPETYSREQREALTRPVPLGRPGTPEQIAAAVRFLATTADYMTGQTITVDGGRSIVP